MYGTAVRQVFLKTVSATPVLFFTQAAGLAEVALYEDVPKNNAYMKAKEVMDAYLGHPSYISTANSAKVDVLFPKHQ